MGVGAYRNVSWFSIDDQENKTTKEYMKIKTFYFNHGNKP
jgi:hypothetical protein